MLIGLWLCLEGLEHGKLTGIFSIGPFVAVVGALWFVSNWFVNERSTKSNYRSWEASGGTGQTPAGTSALTIGMGQWLALK
jgi:hypothetical protein